MPWEDDYEPDEHDLTDDREDPESYQVPCPSCGRMVYDETEKCPYCGDWIMPLASHASKSRPWVKITAAIMAVVFFMVWGMTCL